MQNSSCHYLHYLADYLFAEFLWNRICLIAIEPYLNSTD